MAVNGSQQLRDAHDVKPLHFSIDNPVIHDALLHICRVVEASGGRALLVGGCVRDALLGFSPKDFDLEVYGVSPQKLVEILSADFPVSLVGEAFGVIKVHGLPIDVSIPRRESKVGLGHRGFKVLSDPEMSPREAASRRDYTINAIAYNPATQELLDPFEGLKDLEHRTLRHTSQKFGEDPLRVLRGQQLVGRFSLKAASDTIHVAKSLFNEYGSLPIERIWGEWYKWAGQSKIPSAGLRFLHQTNWIEAYPELAALEGCPQDPRWHPEGDVWTHTLFVTDEAARIGERDNLSLENRAVLVLSALCHDLGKPTNTQVTKEGVRSKGHAGTEDIYQQFLQRIGTPPKYVSRVVTLCLNHLTHLDFVGSSRHVRKLALNLSSGGEDIEMLGRLVEADNSGRPPLPRRLPEKMEQLLALARELTVRNASPKPLLLGRHLVQFGIQPGPQMGHILKEAFTAQIEGKFATLKSAKEWVRKEYFGQSS